MLKCSILLVIKEMKLKAKIRDFLGTPNTGGTGSISGWGTKILYSTHCSQKKKKSKNKIPFVINQMFLPQILLLKPYPPVCWYLEMGPLGGN